MRINLLPTALLPLALVSCQSMSEGVVSLEARAMAYDDTEISQSGAGFAEENVDVSAYGLQAAIMTPILDVTASVDRREFENESSNEVAVGLRRRFLEIAFVHPYVAADLRYGFGLETGFDEVDYAGWALGVGALVDISDHLFLDFKVAYERTLDDIDIGTSDEALEGVVGYVGVGLTF
ncbi:hypothetical protein Pla163_02100 [Planctomycetes bacterium Pla163]|uniref:Outer membrane protein beta-barrel domain-containing protein n=1 Tax=Rohdeia mirabilis TaxID=2528008 RepID=A0A518CV84_9BACT|nr:hypothetical protein Pla163_02100 [Planctomycetes bacterium Pla163]